ncbi:peptidase M1-like protein [Luteococcus japonicus]|uniref:Aminopeptidase N n=1 Tax=Luteococcus japonicus TaxID=33984 RepID=A0A3N1ZY45_9ACTN|nr:M1 family metallopeptidase [Luteococcus japonicus]ROR55771.1 peptidase M1-like protein [Luteococcus japonicus]
MAAPDPYLSGHGDDRYRVRHYDLRLDYKVTTNRLDEVAVLDVEMVADAKQLELDLSGLQVSKVLVDGTKARHRTRNRKLLVELGAAEAGDRFRVTVNCAGKPRPVPGVHGAAGWEELTDGVLVGSQPQGAPGWFPCNDDAADKATYRIQLDVAQSYHVVANGTLVDQENRGGSTRWVYEMDAPMAPYLATVQIGHYVTTDLSGAPVPVQIVHPPHVAVGAGTAFEHQAEMVRHFVDLFGPYPFRQYRAVVANDVLEIPLEAQGLSSFGRNFARPTWENERLVAHELSHQWFGNSVTASQLADIWLHEGFACYSEWLWADHRAATDPRVLDVQAQAERHHRDLAQEKQGLVLTEPGMPNMFDDWVYKRGALTLHAVRACLGDDAFFRMLQSWTATHAGGIVTTKMFVDHCIEFASDDGFELAATLDAWLNQPRLPGLPVLRR